MCSGITRGRVLNGEPYAQRFQKFIYLHLFTDCLMKILLNRRNKYSTFVSMIEEKFS